MATVLVLLPFIGKPFHIDDPLFVWVAQHIQSHPLDPYGFNVNWYGFDQPLWDITKNPPFACYYLALFGSAFGWSERVLHAALLLPAMAVIVGNASVGESFLPDARCWRRCARSSRRCFSCPARRSCAM